MFIYIIIGQFLTFLSYFAFWISRFKKNKENILLWDNISRVIAIAGFLFLGTFDGIKNTLFVFLRNYFGKVTIKKKTKYKLTTFFLLLLILIVMYALNYQGISTLFIAICGVINLYGVIMCNEQGIRVFGMIGSLFYTGFMIFTGNITGVICELFSFMVMLCSYIKYSKK